MNTKIPFNRLAAMIAEDAGISTATAESFLKEFFGTIGDRIVIGEKVSIKKLGTFSRSDNDESPVSYQPSRELAESVNAPFAMFEPEELHEAVSAQMLDAVVDNQVEPALHEETIESIEDEAVTEIPTSMPTAEIVIENESEPDDEETEEEKEEVAENEVVEEKADRQAVPAPPPFRRESTVKESIVEEEDKDEPEQEDQEYQEYQEEIEERKSPGFGLGILIGLIIGIAIGAFAVFMFMQTEFYKGPSTELPSMTTDTATVELPAPEPTDF